MRSLSNAQMVLSPPVEMEGIRKLVDPYMAEKAYLDYNFTQVPQN